MVFSNFSRSEANNQILFRNITPIINVKTLKFYKDDAIGSFIKKEFRWSFNKDYWAGWTTLNQSNISNIAINNNVNLFIEVRYATSGTSSKVNTFSVDYTQTIETLTPTETSPVIKPSVVSPTLVSKSGKDVTFSNFTRTESGNIITFKNSTSIKYVLNLKYYIDNSSGVFSKKEFRWSFNNTYWSSWETLNPGNISNIKMNNNSNLFLEVQYVKTGSTPNVTMFSVSYIQGIGTDITTNQTTKPSTIIDIKPATPCPIKTDYSGDNCNNKPTLIDADLLTGKDGNYYLYRPNHKGQQTISTIVDLQEILDNLSNAWQGYNVKDALNVDGPGIGVYYGNLDGSIYFKTIINGNKLFISEDASGHITLDVDDASINELYTLVGNVNGINVGSIGPTDSGEIFKQKSGDLLEFRTLVAGTNNLQVTTLGSQVRISVIDVSGGTPIWTDPDPVSADVGGIVNGDDVSLGTNSIELLERILYEYFPPNIENLSPLSGYYEKWVNNFDVSLYGEFNNDNFVKTKIYKAEVLINNTSDISYPPIVYPNVNSGIFNWLIAGPSGYEDREYKVNIFNKNGTILYPNASKSINIKFVNPYFFGVVGNEVNINNINSNIITNLNRLIVPEQSNSIDFDVSANYVKLKFVYAYDNSYVPLKNIFDSKNNFNVTSSFETGLKLINNGIQTNIPYRVYIKSHWISFNQDVSVFKLIFNI